MRLAAMPIESIYRANRSTEIFVLHCGKLPYRAMLRKINVYVGDEYLGNARAHPSGPAERNTFITASSEAIAMHRFVHAVDAASDRAPTAYNFHRH
jgi:hypothetical protein